MTEKIPHIVIVGGGAAGIELAALLGRKLGRKNKAEITLVDASATHIWKPLLHEVAAGTLNSNEDELNYMAFASQHFFKFSLGTLQNLNRAKKEIFLAPIVNHDDQEILPRRTLNYDILIIAVGSIANDFNIPGVRQHCFFLDNRAQADYFHLQLINHLLRLSFQSKSSKFNIAIVGGGATGIELIAELHHAVRMMAQYGIQINPDDVTFTLVEASEKLLPLLPERLSKVILDELQNLHVKIYLGEQVDQVTAEGLHTKSGKFIPAAMKVWTAGIKAPDFLAHLDDLEVNRINQLCVKPTLQTTKDDSIFAIGDCASCPQLDTDKTVPPRAQAAHQQAKFLVKSLQDYLQQKPLPDFHFHDHGSLITLSQYQAVGNFMGIITKNLHLEGWLARFFYWSLYKQHQSALLGPWRVSLMTLANALSSRVKPRLKLH